MTTVSATTRDTALDMEWLYQQITPGGEAVAPATLLHFGRVVAQAQIEDHQNTMAVAHRYLEWSRAGVVRHGMDAYEEDPATGMQWWEFPGDWTNDDVLEALDRVGVPTEGARCHQGDWDCCGRLFARNVWVRDLGERKQARQTIGRDI